MPNFWSTGTPLILKIQWFTLSILIFGQKSCFLGPTIFKIPQPNWYYNEHKHYMVTRILLSQGTLETHYRAIQRNNCPKRRTPAKYLHRNFKKHFCFGVLQLLCSEFYNFFKYSDHRHNSNQKVFRWHLLDNIFL